MYSTNRLHVAVRLSSNHQITSKCGKNQKVALRAQLSESLMFLLKLLHVTYMTKYTSTFHGYE